LRKKTFQLLTIDKKKSKIYVLSLIKKISVNIGRYFNIYSWTTRLVDICTDMKRARISYLFDERTRTSHYPRPWIFIDVPKYNSCSRMAKQVRFVGSSHLTGHFWWAGSIGFCLCVLCWSALPNPQTKWSEPGWVKLAHEYFRFYFSRT
jgi:hypothetical protein